MMSKNSNIGKKGFVFVTFVVVMTTIALLSALFVLSAKYQVKDKDGVMRLIGQNQAELFKLYQSGENAMFYLSESGNIAGEMSFNDLAVNGSGCGAYLGFSMWSDDKKQCFPSKEDLQNKFKSIFLDRVNKLGFSFQDASIPPINKIDISEGNKIKIIGSADASLTISKAKIYPDVKVTHYYAPLEKDFPVWYSGEDPTDLKKYPNYPIDSWCVLPLSKRGFYEDVKCEGAGIGTNGEYYDYKGIKPIKDDSKKTDKIATYSGTAATPHKTIAVAPDMIPYGSRVDVEFQGCTQNSCCSQWNGEYLAEDTGSAMQADWRLGNPHIDLFVGSGLTELKNAECLPGGEVNRATLSVKPMNDISTGDSTYKLKTILKTEVNYSFNEYDALEKNITKLSEKITQNCFSQSGELGKCIQNVLDSDKDFKLTYECGNENQKVASSLAEAMILCSQSKEGACVYEIPDTNGKTEITLTSNKLDSTTSITSDSLNEKIPQDFPLVINSEFSETSGILTPQIKTCEELNVEISNGRATLTGKNCPGINPYPTFSYVGKIPLYNSLSKSNKENLVSFIEPSVYDKQSGKLNVLSLSKKELRICAESKYSFIDVDGEKKPYVYKIAFFAGDTVPPAKVENIVVSDTKHSEKNATVTFDAGKEPDLDHYEIYYSSQNIITLSDENVKQSRTIMHTRIGKYSDTILLPEDGKFYFAVIAVDKSGNKGLFDPVQGESIDDLQPGPIQKVELQKQGAAPIFDVFITPPTSNEDGTPLTDLKTYTIYAKQQDSCSGSDVSSVLSKPDNKYDSLEFDVSKPIHTSQIDLSGLTLGKNYCIAFLAEDDNKNNPLTPSRYSSSSIISVKT